MDKRRCALMGNESGAHDATNLTRLEFLLAQIVNGDGLRTLHDAVVILERFYTISNGHDCPDVECIVPEFREVAGRFIEFMKEQRYQTLPAAAIYVDMGLAPMPPVNEEKGIFHPEEGTDIANALDEWFRGQPDEGPGD
jgi:hypothetical protein